MDYNMNQSSRQNSRRAPLNNNSTRNYSPFGGAPDNKGHYGSSSRDNAGSYGASLRKRSPEANEDAYIEQRHEELKRQIALKERQLAEMTGERDTAERLRQRLGLGKTNSSRGNLQQEKPRDSRNAFSSASPLQDRTSNQMVGLRSSHMRQNSASGRDEVPQEASNQRQQFNISSQSSYQQLQFHPTRLQRPVPQKSSPLRNRSVGSGGIASYQPEVIEEEPYERQQADSLPSYKRPDFSNTGGYTLPPRDPNYRSNSPLRSKSRSPHAPNRVEDSNRVIKPLPISSNRASGVQLHQRNYSFAPHNDLSSVTNIDERDRLYRERIEAMTADNASLQRRLNQVTKELERIERERDDIRGQLAVFETDNGRLDGILQSKDPVDMQNQTMKDELQRKREENGRIAKQIQDYEIENNNFDKKLQQAISDKKNLAIESDNINHEIGVRIRKLDELSRDRQITLQKLTQTNSEIDKLNREELQYNHENIDLETHVSRLMHERQELLKNLQSTTYTFDECVRDITRERRNMDGQNDWQTKLLVTKILFENIEKFQRLRMQNAYTEMTDYCRFDKECHSKLKSFANVLRNLGHYKLKRAINVWYTSALKPLQTRIQNDDISIVIDCNRLQAKVFYAWRQYQRDKMDCYQFKTNAIERMFALLIRGSKCELKRAMQIWKGKMSCESHMLKKFKELIKKRNHRLLGQAVMTWSSFSKCLGHTARVRILQMEFRNKLYLQHIFSQMKLTLRNEKRKRIRILNSFVKAWKDYVHYNRHLMQVNMAAIQFGQTNRNYLIRSIFDALKQNYETRKHQVLRHAVENDLDVAIAETKKFNEESSSRIKHKNKFRAGEIVSIMLGRKLFAYFNHWRNVNKNYQNTMQTKVKSRIIKMYCNYLQSYFDHWKDGGLSKDRKKRMKMMQELQKQNELLQNEALQGEKNLRAIDEGVRSSKRKMVDKTFRKLFYRKLSLAMGRWKDICLNRKEQEDKAALVIKRMRNRYLRQAFDRYLEFLKKSQQRGRNLKSADYMKETLDKRTLRKHFYALCFHRNRQAKSRKYWTKILGRMDAYMKKRAIQIWCDNAHLAYQESLQGTQGDQNSEIFQQNEMLGKLEKQKLEQLAAIEAQMKLRKKKAYRQIGNYFMRGYAETIFWKFKTWKDNIHSLKHKEQILRRTLEHYKRIQFENVRRVFIKFMSEDRRREALEKMKQVQIESNEINQKIKHNKDLAAIKKQKEEQDIEITGNASEEMQRKVLHVMNWMEKNNRTRVFCSKKRMIFMCWRQAAKEQKAFLLCVQNVLQKSMFNLGLTSIKNAARAVQSHNLVERALKRFRNRCFKNNASDAFNRWKASINKNVEAHKDDVIDDMKKKDSEFLEFVDKTKETNLNRCYNYFMEKNKQNLWKAWVNVIKSIKLTKAKTKEFHKRALIIRRKDAIDHWKARVERTKNCRAKNNNLVNQFKFKYFRAAFYALQKNWRNTSKLAKSLSNLERMYRERNYGDSFKCIRTYAVSKGLVMKNRRMKGTEDLVNLVKQAYLKNLQREFLRYKNKALGDSQKNSKLKACWGKVITARMRDAFYWWKRRSDMAQLKLDMNETGPERAQYWQAMREIENYREFLRSEHYTENEIEQICNKVFNRNEHLMRKYMIRLRIRQDSEKNQLPHIWQRWKDYVAIRKLIKYQFRYMENRLTSQKADLQAAFRKWRNGPDQLATELWRLPVQTLIRLAGNTTQEVQLCGDTLAENNSIQNHLMMQRDEFLNYYIKGQVLAMALLKDRNRFAEMQSISRWMRAKRILKANEDRREIRDNEYLIANLQNKQKEFEEANENLIKENKDLGSFTQDGLVIRKNMDKLVEETNRIKSQIGETDDDLADLIKNNERLKKEVEEAEEAANQIKEQGFNKFNNPDMNQLKDFAGQQNKSQSVINQQEAPKKETEEERQKRERFERLNKISKGAALR